MKLIGVILALQLYGFYSHANGGWMERSIEKGRLVVRAIGGVLRSDPNGLLSSRCAYEVVKGGKANLGVDGKSEKWLSDFFLAQDPNVFQNTLADQPIFLLVSRELLPLEKGLELRQLNTLVTADESHLKVIKIEQTYFRDHVYKKEINAGTLKDPDFQIIEVVDRFYEEKVICPKPTTP